ncbi:hypothetical protein JOB18_048659 [Solea senegalensis]|uniref:Uncharacterized protein n=1 Tax=Solea senegalensis TaxID=28829 RepID=A0AAV6QFE2_SOLSE|nr:cyclin-dependent kinase 12-like [Solea senegalensis]KAG7487192.1 hypothetical protein JOB18_048659 [Solea senegalensis]
MYSNRSEHSHRRQHGDRSSRQWNDRREPHRDVPRDSFQKYDRAEGGNRSREYSDSPQRRYSQDWSRKSPVRRRGSSPDRGATEKKRRRFVDHDDDHKYRCEPEDKTYRQSPDGFSHQPKDFKHSLPQKDNFKYKKTSQDSRHRHEEFSYRTQHDDHRPASGYHKDRDHRERSWERSEGSTRSQESSMNNFVKGGAREDSPSRRHEDPHHQSSARFPLNEPCGQSFERDLINQTPTLPEQKSNEGFQRFLDVLNKGVNVAMLTKIVTRPSPEANNPPHSPGSFTDTVQHLWSPDSDEKQQGSHQNNGQWSESEGPRRPHCETKTFSPVGRSLSDDTSLQRSDGGQSHHGSNSRFKSPSVVANKTMTPEDEHKHKQIQDVLQAIGLDLGSEELGQMSHRIQERLYGKKDVDLARCRGGSRERDTRRAISPQYRSRSSSSNRSNFSSLTGDSYMKKDSCHAQMDGTEVHPIQALKTGEYVQNNSSDCVQDSDKCETTATFQTFSHDNTYSVSEPPPPPPPPTVPLTYSPVNYSPLPYSPLPPPLPPNLPHVRPSVFLPPYLPFPPVPPVPPVNFFPPTNHLLPQHIINPQSNFQNRPQMNQHQPVNNAQKSKPQPRPRCLQVIQTKQPG